MILNLSAEIAWFEPVSFCDWSICGRSNSVSCSVIQLVCWTYYSLSHDSLPSTAQSAQPVARLH